MNAMLLTSVAAYKRMAGEEKRIRSTCGHRRMLACSAEGFVSKREVMSIVEPVTHRPEQRCEPPRTG